MRNTAKIRRRPNDKLLHDRPGIVQTLKSHRLIWVGLVVRTELRLEDRPRRRRMNNIEWDARGLGLQETWT